MTDNKTVTVTEDVGKSMKALEEAIETMQEGDDKEKAKAVLNYLSALFKGDTLPNIFCPGGGFLIR